MATTDNNWPSTARKTASEINPFVGYANPAETLRNIKHGLYFIAATAGSLENASDMALDGLQLCTECMIHALQQEEKMAEADEVSA